MEKQLTFDQILAKNPSADAVEHPVAFLPHTAMNAKLVFEPMPSQGHVRITARSDAYELLWGVTASPTSLSRHPVEVAFYDRLINEAKKHIPVQTNAEGTDMITSVLQKVSQLRNILDAIQSSLTPKKVSDKTEKRAAEIAPKVDDALRLLDSRAAKESNS